MELKARWLLYTAWIVLILLVWQVFTMKIRIEELERDSVRAQQLFGTILKYVKLRIEPLEGDPFIEGVLDSFDGLEIHYESKGEGQEE